MHLSLSLHIAPESSEPVRFERMLVEDLHAWVLVVMCTYLRKYHAKAYFASFPAYFDSHSGIIVRAANVSVRSGGFRTQDIVYPS